MALVRSPGVLVRVWFHFVLVDHRDEYEMKSTIHRYLVNWIIASCGWSNEWWKLGGPVWWSTESNSAGLYICRSVNLLKLNSLLIFVVYCPSGIVIPKSVDRIRVFKCAWSSKCNSNYQLLANFRRTRHWNCETIRDIHWINYVENFTVNYTGESWSTSWLSWGRSNILYL